MTNHKNVRISKIKKYWKLKIGMIRYQIIRNKIDFYKNFSKMPYNRVIKEFKGLLPGNLIGSRFGSTLLILDREFSGFVLPFDLKLLYWTT